MRVTLCIGYLALLLHCSFTEGDVLMNLKKVSKIDDLKSDSSDVIRALQRGKRDVTEDVAKSRKKRDFFGVAKKVRRIIYTLSDNRQSSEGKWKKLVKLDQEPISLHIVRRAFFGGSHGGITFYIDRSVTQAIHVTVRGGCDSFDVTSPAGKVTSFPLLRNYMRHDFYSPRSDNIGAWKIMTSPDAEDVCSLEVVALCSMGFTMSLMTKHIDQSDSAYRAIEGNPIKHKSLAVILDGFGMEALKSGGKDMVDTVRFVNQSGYDVIDPVRVTDDVDGLNSKVKVYLNNGLKTSRPVYVIIEGKDYQGYRFTRTIPEPIEASHVMLTCQPRDVIIQPKVETTFDVIVRNHGPNDTLTVIAHDSEHLTNAKYVPLQINAKETVPFPISAFAKRGIKNGTRSRLEFSVQGSLPGSSQQTSCNIVVGKPSNPRIDSLTIDGTINSRFAETIVTSVMSNYADVGLQAKFDVLLPIDAFITNLTMTLDDDIIVGKVNKKEKSKKIYEKAKKRGKTTAHVTARGGSTRLFKTRLFVGPGKNVTFKFTYHQLLGRSRGSYKYAVNLNPNQLVKKLKVSVHIEEEEEIDYITISHFEGVSTTEARHPAGTSVVFGHRKRSAHIKYNPLPAQQTAFNPSNTFSVLYDVVRTKVYGDVTVANNYFAHFYTPVHLAPAPKRVIFVIDKSGSMKTTKMNQVKDAMTTILKSLEETDFFGVLFFNDRPSTEGLKLERATAPNVKSGLERVAAVTSSGGTRIISAFRVVFEEFSRFFRELDGSSEDDSEISGSFDSKDEEEDEEERYDEKEYTNMIVFLTDGQGESPASILNQVSNWNDHDIEIHTIAFGEKAGRELLKSLAAANDGTYRLIFDGFTASAQIENFFEEITAPSLRNISITYPLNRVTDVTQSEFKVISAKSEIVWAGKLKEEEKDLLDVDLDEPQLIDFNEPSKDKEFVNAHLSGSYLGEALDIDIPIDPKKATSRIMTSEHQIENFTEKLWAFLQVKQLLKETLQKRRGSESKLARDRALNMSLKYNFVTPLTSMVVLKDLEDIEEELRSEENEKLQKIKDEKLRRKEEERERLLQIQREEQLLRDLYKKRRDRPRSRYSGRRGGGYGDPHFIIPLQQDINLCFNWDGQQGEVYNLFYDPSAGVTVNGQLIRTEADEHSRKTHKTYVSSLGLVLPKQNLRILIHPHDVTLISEGLRNITLPVLSPMAITRHGVMLRMHDVKTKTAKIALSGEDWSFNILVTRNIHNHHQACHVDFFVDSYKNHLMSPLSGIIGQFLDSDVSVAHDNKLNQTIMTINNRSGPVTTIERTQPLSREKVTCWSSHGNAHDIIQGSHEHYLVEGVLKTPSYYWI